jgi:hypothetical protein
MGIVMQMRPRLEARRQKLDQAVASVRYELKKAQAR